MSLISMLLILFGNIIAITIIYFILKKIDKKDKNNNKDKLIFIAICIGIIYISISIIYWITGFGVEEAVNEYSKNYIVYSFVPINVILLIPFVAMKYSQFKINKIKKRDFVKSVIQVVIVGIIVLVIEGATFNSLKTLIYEKNVIEITKKQNEKTTENKENTNKTTTYKQFLNEIPNENSTNVINDSTTVEENTIVKEKTNTLE